MTEFTLTDEQSAIVSAMAGGSASPGLLIEAGAGCAKSTTIEAGAKGIKSPALALAFSRRDSERMAKKFPGNFLCKSFNSLGHGAWARRISGGITLDEGKMGKIVTRLAKEDGVRLSSDQWSAIRGLAEFAMTQGIVPAGAEGSGEARGLTPDDPWVWLCLAEDRVTDRSEIPFHIDLARRAIAEGIRMAHLGQISYDDQVYCSVLFGGIFPTFSTIILDEDQDLSPLNIAMVARASRGDSPRIIGVGDRRQALYAFRGAAGEAAEQLRQISARPSSELPLMTTFRCPELIVERQRGHVPGFRAWSGAKRGVIRRLDLAEGDEGWSWRDITAEASRIDPAGGRSPEIAVICRNNGPLLALAFKLIRGGVSVRVLGREIGKGLVALSRKLCPEDSLGASACREAIDLWAGNEAEVLHANGKDEKIAGVWDRAECLLAVLDGGAPDAGTLRGMLERLFAQTTGTVTLSSGHKSKGGEWDVVVHLDPWRIPSKWARKAAEAGRGEALAQERNLQYVLETRTKHTLVLAGLREFSGV